jgi:hypothetical protein
MWLFIKNETGDLRSNDLSASVAYRHHQIKRWPRCEADRLREKRLYILS